MADENVVNGKLLLVNAGDGNYPSDYNYTMPEHTKSDMYYTYMEVIIPTDKIQTYDANEEFAIMFGNSSETTMFFRGFSNGSSGEGHIEILMRPNDVDPVFPTITNMDEINTLFSNEYVVVSLMILPKLNKNPLITPDSIYTNSLAVFINGIQLEFEYNDTNIPLLVLPSMLNGGNFIRNYSIPNGSYMIFNTEYERFIYKNLANMCYSENQKKAIQVENIKKNIISTTGSDIVFRSSYPFSHTTKFLNNWQYLSFNSDFLSDTENPIKLYMEIEIPTSLYDRLDGLAGVSFDFSLAQLKYDSLNIIDQANSVYSTRYDSNSFGWEEEDDLYETQRADYTWFNYIANYSNTFNINNKIPSDRPKDYLYIIYMIANNADGDLHGYLGVQNLNRDEYDISVDLEDKGHIDILPTDKCFPYFSMFSGGEDVYDFSVNIGEGKFHTIPSQYTDKESKGYSQLFRSTTNAHWKSLWKHSRTIQFTTYLQDNPVIFPLDLFRNNNENMFVEIKVERQNNSKVEYAVGTGIELYDSTDNENIKNINKGIWHCEGSTLSNANVLGHKTGASVGGGDLKNYYSIALYYNIKRSKKCIYVLSSDGAGIDESDNRYFSEINVKQDNIDITNFKNIYIHLIPEDKESSVVGTELGTITINFGPTALNSDFQKYIDELLKQDELPDIQYHKANIFKNHNYHVLTPYFGYDMDNDVIAGYDKGVWK